MLVLALVAIAQAADIELQQQLRVLDSSGSPRTSATLEVFLTDGAAQELWSKDYGTVALQDGYTTLLLALDDENDPIDSAWMAAPAFVQVFADGVALGAPQALASVPRAGSAERAASIDVVADATGACTPGRIVFDAGDGLVTVCDQGGTWRSLPADLLDGDDDTTYTAGAGLVLTGTTLSTDARVPRANTYTKLVQVRSQGHISPAGDHSVYIDGALATTAGRGYAVTALRLSDGAQTYYGTFDTYASGSQATLMAAALNAIGSDHLVIVNTWDEPKLNRLTNGLDAAMYRCGASPEVFGGGTTTWYSQSAYILVGICGYGAGSGEEFYSGDVNADPTAAVDYGFELRDGVWIR